MHVIPVRAKAERASIVSQHHSILFHTLPFVPAHVSSLSSSPSRPAGGTSLIAHASVPRPPPCRGTHLRALALVVPRAVARPARRFKKGAIGRGQGFVEYPQTGAGMEWVCVRNDGGSGRGKGVEATVGEVGGETDEAANVGSRTIYGRDNSSS